MDWIPISAISFFIALFLVYSRFALKVLRKPRVR
jgi:hypothetical protein